MAFIPVLGDDIPEAKNDNINIVSTLNTAHSLRKIYKNLGVDNRYVFVAPRPNDKKDPWNSVIVSPRKPKVMRVVTVFKLSNTTLSNRVGTSWNFDLKHILFFQ